MKGGTTFHFVTGGIEEALDLAEAAGAKKTFALAAVSRPSGSICAPG